LAQRGRPGGLGEGGDRLFVGVGDRLFVGVGDRPADGERDGAPPGVQLVQVFEQVVGGAGAVDADQQFRRYFSGIWAMASLSTRRWSVTVLEPAMPGRSSPDSASRLPSRKQNSGWWPKV
jgi:hypothetical protein